MKIKRPNSSISKSKMIVNGVFEDEQMHKILMIFFIMCAYINNKSIKFIFLQSKIWFKRELKI